MAFKMKGNPMARNYGAPFTKPEGEDHSDEAHSNTKGHHDPVSEPNADILDGVDKMTQDRVLLVIKRDECKPAMTTERTRKYHEADEDVKARKKDIAEETARARRLGKGSGKPGPYEY